MFSYEPAKVNDVPRAIDLQNILELVEWTGAAGDPLAYAPHLRSSTLPGVPIKPVLFQIARGDRTAPNPGNTALIRAANMRESTYLYRHDLARQVAPSLDENPHTYLVNLLSLPALAIALAAQQQAAAFLATGDGGNPNTVVRLLYRTDLFEIPDPLPEDLNY